MFNAYILVIANAGERLAILMIKKIKKTFKEKM